MKDKEITNVILMEKPSLNQELWRETSRNSTKEKDITSVNPVENPSVAQVI